MKVRVLGCSGAIAKDCHTTSFLIDADLLVDAGTGVGSLRLDEMRAIDHVLLTHSHLDHFAALPLMIDAVAGQRQEPLHVHALPGTIAALRTHIFNNVIWPDFTRIPDVQSPFVRLHEIAVDQVLEINGRRIEVLPAEHTVPAVGYAVSTVDSRRWVYSGDTERNPAFWQRVNAMPNIGMLVIETAFSRREQELAVLSRHLAPDSLATELARLSDGHEFPIYIMHTKPAETSLIMSEVHEIDLQRPGQARRAHEIHWLQAGQEFAL